MIPSSMYKETDERECGCFGVIKVVLRYKRSRQLAWQVMYSIFNIYYVSESVIFDEIAFIHIPVTESF